MLCVCQDDQLPDGENRHRRDDGHVRETAPGNTVLHREGLHVSVNPSLNMLTQRSK